MRVALFGFAALALALTPALLMADDQRVKLDPVTPNTFKVGISGMT